MDLTSQSPQAPQAEATAAPENSTPVVENTHDFKATKHKVKIDGKEMEVPYEQLLAEYQLGNVSRRKMEEAAHKEKQIYEFLDTLKKGDLSLLEDLIPQESLHKFSYSYLDKLLKYEEMTPEQREIMELKRFKEQKTKEEESKKGEELSRKKQEESNRAIEWLDVQISNQVDKLKEKYGKFKVTTAIANEIARELEAQILSEDGEDSEPDIDAISDKTWKKWSERAHAYLSQLPVDELKHVLTKEQLSALRRSDLDAALGAAQTRKIPTQERPKENKQYKNFDEQFDDLINRRIRG